MSNGKRDKGKLGRRGATLMLGAVLALTLSGCGDADVTASQTPVNYDVSIKVPFATATPLPSGAASTDQPLSISAEGKVKLNDSSYLDTTYTQEDEAETDGVYIRLETGDTGSEVKQLQTRLKQLNYYAAEITGIYDSVTEAAVKSFELTYGTMQTGVASPSFQEKLFAADAPIYGSSAYEDAVASRYKTLQRSDVGGAVRALQQRLIDLGYPIAAVTGVFDEETAAAVSLFYEAYDFTPNDVATIAMQRELYSDNARKYGKQEDTEEESATDIYTISNGSMGTLVLQLQTRLVQLGYLTSSVTGTYDDATVQAVNLFESALGLPQTGEADVELQQIIASPAAPTWREIEKLPETGSYGILQKGDSGYMVKNLQDRLVELGYANGTPNGKYDDITIRVVNLFREKVKMDQTGVASAEMQALLYSEFAPQYGEDIENKATIAPDAYETSVPDATVEPTMVPTMASAQEQIYQDLQEEDSGQGVLELETRLNALGYFEGTPDETYDADTTDAVKLFQKALGIRQSGKASTNLQYHLFSEASPKKGVRLWDDEQNFQELFLGDVSDGVLNMQKALWELGFLDRANIENAYGVFNDATLTAMQSAQKAMGYHGYTTSASIEFQAFLLSKYNTRIQQEQ